MSAHELSAPASQAQPVRLAIDAVVTHHLDGFRSGVSRFNELLAERLAVPLFSIFDRRLEGCTNPLLSFKVSELSEEELGLLTEILDGRRWRGELYLHDFQDSPLERRIVAEATRVHCGNARIREQVEELNTALDTLWTPGLVRDARVFEPAQLSVFSFGMAHKIRTEMFRRLRALLDGSESTYVVYVSAANHETASIRDAQVVFEEMTEIFPRRLYFLGNLSDVAVFNYLQQSTFFAAFFDDGVRANNTSVASAMELGAVVITNLDRYSPPELQHMDNVIDIERCDALPDDPLVLRRISVRAMETARARGWEELAGRLRLPDTP
jgi:hypothetical protein